MTIVNQIIASLRDEQIATYARAFIERGGDYVILDGWSKRWQWDDIRQLTELGWMTFDEATSKANSDEQYTAQVYRPTPEFVEALRQIAAAPSVNGRGE